MSLLFNYHEITATNKLIRMNSVLQNDLKKVIKDYSDLEAQSDEAQKLLAAIHETYLQKKLIFSFLGFWL